MVLLIIYVEVCRYLTHDGAWMEIESLSFVLIEEQIETNFQLNLIVRQSLQRRLDEV